MTRSPRARCASGCACKRVATTKAGAGLGHFRTSSSAFMRRERRSPPSRCGDARSRGRLSVVATRLSAAHPLVGSNAGDESAHRQRLRWGSEVDTAGRRQIGDRNPRGDSDAIERVNNEHAPAVCQPERQGSRHPIARGGGRVRRTLTSGSSSGQRRSVEPPSGRRLRDCGRGACVDARAAIGPGGLPAPPCPPRLSPKGGLTTSDAPPRVDGRPAMTKELEPHRVRGSLAQQAKHVRHYLSVSLASPALHGTGGGSGDHRHPRTGVGLHVLCVRLDRFPSHGGGTTYAAGSTRETVPASHMARAADDRGPQCGRQHADRRPPAAGAMRRRRSLTHGSAVTETAPAPPIDGAERCGEAINADQPRRSGLVSRPPSGSFRALANVRQREPMQSLRVVPPNQQTLAVFHIPPGAPQVTVSFSTLHNFGLDNLNFKGGSGETNGYALYAALPRRSGVRRPAGRDATGSQRS